MPATYECLTAWRLAERACDTIGTESADWASAHQLVRNARSVFHETLARTAARYDEPASPPPLTWWPAMAAIRTDPAL